MWIFMYVYVCVSIFRNLKENPNFLPSSFFFHRIFKWENSKTVITSSILCIFSTYDFKIQSKVAFPFVKSRIYNLSVPEEKNVKEYLKDLKSSECDAWAVYLQVLECFASLTLALMIHWVLQVEIGATQ